MVRSEFYTTFLQSKLTVFVKHFRKYVPHKRVILRHYLMRIIIYLWKDVLGQVLHKQSARQRFIPSDLLKKCSQGKAVSKQKKQEWEERKQSKGVVVGKASGRLQLIPQGNWSWSHASELSHQRQSSCAVISGHLRIIVSTLNFPGT